MIISHKHKFIFLKTSKTAGTSIEIALSRICGEDDIITPISPEDEKIRKDLGCVEAQNYLAPIRNYRLRDVIELLIKGKRKKRFFNHITARAVQEQIGEQIWNSYFKFCFERNPWDRIVSQYYWRYKSEPRPSISEFLNSNIPLNLKRKGFEVYTINGEIVVDKVCRFENINEELEEIRKQLDIAEKLNLPHAKAQFRKDKRRYTDILDVKQKESVAELFSDEIRLFGYKF